jgi:putative copper export protein
MLVRFGRIALIAFAITAMTGVLAAAPMLGSPSDLWTSTYGLVLSVKTAGVVVMMLLSGLAWRRGFGLIRFEAALALIVLAATAVLAASPIPAATSEGIVSVSARNTH